jgi:hypothetical protein
MSDVTTMIGAGLHTFVFLPFSAVAKLPNRSLRDGTSVVLGGFSIAPGHWIVQAKATARGTDPAQHVDVQLHLTVRGDKSAEDKTLATPPGLGYATLALSLGIIISAHAEIELRAMKSGHSSADLSNIVITAFRQERLILAEL